MLDFLIAILIIGLLVAFPALTYLVVAQYKIGEHVEAWWFKRNHTFPDQPNTNDTRKMTIRKNH